MSEATEEILIDDNDNESFISCRFCKNVFKSTENFLKHYCRNLRKKQLYTCYICKRHFSDLNLLNEHASHHPRKKFYKCYFCKKDFKNLTEQRNHIMLHKLSYSNEILSDKFHLINLNKSDDKTESGASGRDNRIDEENQTISSVKGNQFGGVKETQIIPDTTETNTYHCSICNITFPNISLLVNHNCEQNKPDTNKHYSLRSDHSKKKKHCYLCNNCNKSCEQVCYSKSYLGLCKHCQSIGFHELSIPKNTSKIHKTSTKSADMKKVLSTIDNKKLHTFATNECTKSKDVILPNEFIKSKSGTISKSFRCGLCDTEYKNSYNLKEHMTSHELKREDSLFICVKCKQNFDDINEFKKHEETHKKYLLKAYICKTCKRNYKTLHDLIEHMRTHPEYCFSCEKCQETFTSITKYEEHKTVCNQENIDDVSVTDYHCDVCQKSFPTRPELEQHNFDCEKFLDQFETVKNIVALQEACKNCGENLQEIIDMEEGDSEENQMFTELIDDLFTCEDCLETTPEKKIVSCDDCLENIPDLFKNENQFPKYEITRRSPRMFEVKYLTNKYGKLGYIDGKGNFVVGKHNVVRDEEKNRDESKSIKPKDIRGNFINGVKNIDNENFIKEEHTDGRNSFRDRTDADRKQYNFEENEGIVDDFMDGKQNIGDKRQNFLDRTQLDSNIGYDSDMKRYDDEIKSYTSDMKHYGDDVKSYGDDIKSYDRDVKLGEDIKRYMSDMKRYDDGTKSYGDGIESYSDHIKSYDDHIKSYGDTKSYGDDRKSYDDHIKSYGDDIKSYGETKSYGDDTKSYGDDTKSYDDHIKSYGDDIKSYGDTKSYGDDTKSYGDDRKSYENDIKRFDDDLKSYTSDIKSYDDGIRFYSNGNEMKSDGTPNIGNGKYNNRKLNGSDMKLNISDNKSNNCDGNSEIYDENNVGKFNFPDKKQLIDRKEQIVTNKQDFVSDGQDIVSDRQDIVSDRQNASDGQDISSDGQNISSNGQDISSDGQDVSDGQVVISNQQDIGFDQEDSSDKPITEELSKRNVSNKNESDYISAFSDYSEIDEKSINNLRQEELLDLLNEIDFPETEDIPIPEVYNCEVCGEEFNYINDLDVHKYIHSDKKNFICADCRIGFLDLFQLESHKCDTRNKY